MTKSRAALILGLGILLVVMHVGGLALEFYWRLGWYDRVVHTLAGTTVALVVFSLGATRQAVKHPILLFFGTLAASFVVGVLWELFELKAGITVFGEHGYAVDTMWDIICDVFGGLIAAGYLLLMD